MDKNKTFSSNIIAGDIAPSFPVDQSGNSLTISIYADMPDNSYEKWAYSFDDILYVEKEWTDFQSGSFQIDLDGTESAIYFRGMNNSILSSLKAESSLQVSTPTETPNVYNLKDYPDEFNINIGHFYRGTLSNCTRLHGNNIPIKFMEELHDTDTYTYNYQSYANARTSTSSTTIHSGTWEDATVRDRPGLGVLAHLRSSSTKNQHNANYSYYRANNYESNSAEAARVHTPLGWAQGGSVSFYMQKITESGSTFPTNNNLQWTTEVYDYTKHVTNNSGANPGFTNASAGNAPIHTSRYNQTWGSNPGSFTYDDNEKRYVYNGGNSFQYSTNFTGQNFLAPDGFIWMQPQSPDKSSWGSDAFADAWTFTIQRQGIVTSGGYQGTGATPDYWQTRQVFLIKNGQNYIDASSWGDNDTTKYADINGNSAPFKVQLVAWVASQHPAKLENSWLLSNDGTELTYYAGDTPSIRSFDSLRMRSGFQEHAPPHNVYKNRVGLEYLNLALDSETTNPNLKIEVENLAAIAMHMHQQPGTHRNGKQIYVYNEPHASKWWWDKDNTTSADRTAYGLLTAPTGWSYNSTLGSHIIQ